MTVSAPTEEVVARVVEGRRRIGEELRKVIIGQDDAVDQLLIALFTGGHCLLTGVPGLAKTLLVRTLAEILDLSFKRIQFTPDLMPATSPPPKCSTTPRHRALRFVRGPVFANVRSPTRSTGRRPRRRRAARGMQEYHVTAGGREYPLGGRSCPGDAEPIELEAPIRCPRPSSIAHVQLVMDTCPKTTRSSRHRDHRHRPASIRRGSPRRRHQAFQQVCASRGLHEVARYTVRLVDASRPNPADAKTSSASG